MSAEGETDRQLFEFYTQGTIQFSALLLASTLGVFSPYAVIASNELTLLPKVVLGVIYVVFSVASGFSLTRLIGNVWLMYTVMPRALRVKHAQIASRLDIFNLGKEERVMRLGEHAKFIEAVAFVVPVLIYLSLLILTVL